MLILRFWLIFNLQGRLLRGADSGVPRLPRSAGGRDPGGQPGPDGRGLQHGVRGGARGAAGTLARPVPHGRLPPLAARDLPHGQRRILGLDLILTISRAFQLYAARPYCAHAVCVCFTEPVLVCC